ncbi:MAG: hypothetical protein ACI9U2_002332 [Bradymonadia bacterium]|jgi:hypothetical protein
MSKTIHRRTVLRGLGAAVALPWLECMVGKPAMAQEIVPKRYAIVFAGQSLGGDQWEQDRQQIRGERYQEAGHFIAPAEQGAGYGITTPLQPLADMQADFSVVSNLFIPYNANSEEGDAVPAGGAYRDFHGGAASPLISGTRSTQASFRAEGITSDQVVAGVHRGQTNLDSLVLRAQPSWYLNGSSYAGREYLSYRGARDPIEAQTSPRIAYETLFGNFVPEGAEAQREHAWQQRARLAVLDRIGSKRQQLVRRVGVADRIRLEAHFDRIRDLERRIEAIPPPAVGACQQLAAFGEDPAIGGNNAGAGANEIQPNTGYSNEHDRARLMADLIHMAFVCDLTRTATLQLTSFQSHMNVLPITTAMGTPIRADLHEVGHNGDEMNRGQFAVSTCLKWHVSHYAYLVDKLRNTPEGDGTVLDNSAIIFMPEGGHGTQLNDAVTPWQTHSTENMVLLLAGRAGGLRPGMHHDAGRAHPAQVLISAMRGAGFGGDSLGEVSGHFAPLFG